MDMYCLVEYKGKTMEVGKSNLSEMRILPIDYGNYIYAFAGMLGPMMLFCLGLSLDTPIDLAINN